MSVAEAAAPASGTATESQPSPAGQETQVGSIFVSNYPPFSAWRRELVGEALAALDRPARPGTPLGLYLHIPFCRKRCKFCYFRVYTDKNHDEIGGYLEALSREVELLAARPAVAGRPLTFVYFGGGTPSYLSVKQLESLVERVRGVLPWDGAEEVTFECEPGTLSFAKLQTLRELGVTRLSLGVESFDDRILTENGRAHTTKEIDRCLPWLEEVAFPQLNIDLIAGMVGETWESWKKSVARTVELAPDSVTIYQLELPYNTRYAASLLEGSLGEPLADWQAKRAWHRYAIEELAAHGYERSSAYTMVKKDRGARFVYRNSVWQGCDLLGTGVASFGHINGVHMQNVDGWGEYIALLQQGTLPLGRAFVTSEEERLTRELILQLKLGELSGAPFQEKFGVDIFQAFAPAFERLAEQGMIELAPGVVRLKPEGLLQVDRLLPEFYAEKYRNARYT
ncbi:MAG: coproporphyrinogen-III oxidase family protein [Thermoanaerobaculia bacterium]|mgnify:CR=1 FL=1